MAEGTVKWFDLVKGYGFIDQGTGKDLFVHKSDVQSGVQLTEGMEVEFEVVQGKKGPCAADVRTK